MRKTNFPRRTFPDRATVSITTTFAAPGNLSSPTPSTDGGFRSNRALPRVTVLVSHFFFCLCFAAGLSGTALAAALDPLDQWTLRHESPPLLPATISALNGIAFGNNLYVTVGKGGAILTTSDPESVPWSVQQSGSTNSFTAVTFANRNFVAVGDAGTIVTSTEGTNWIRQTSGTRSLLKNLAYGNGFFVVVGFDTILSSPDGVTWTQQKVPSPASGIADVGYGNGIFVAVGFNTILTSADGVTWTSQKCPTAVPLTSVAFGNDLYVAVSLTGTVLTSPDAVTWKEIKANLPAGVYYDVISFKGTFVVIGGQTDASAASSLVVTSKDGTTWTSGISANASLLLSVTMGKDRLVAVGGGSVGPAPLPNAIVTSDDGIAWREPRAPLTLRGIAFGNDAFVAVGSGGAVLTSPDGMTWRISDSGAGTQLNDIAYNGQTFVAVGNQGAILTSENGTAWVQRKSNVTLNLNGVAFGSGQFAVVGGEQVPAMDGTLAAAPRVILTSTNGVDWTSRENESVSMALYDVTYGNGGFAAVGGGQPLAQPASWITATSDNGSTWRGKLETFRDFITGIAFGNRIFVAVGQTDSIFTSADGEIWTQSRPADAPLLGLAGVSFGNGVFCAFGPQGTLYSSTNGNSWLKRKVGTTRDLHAIAYGNGRFVAVGDLGTILQSGQFEAPSGSRLLEPTLANGQFSVSFQTLTNKKYTLESKRALSETSWQSLTVVLGDGNLKTATDTSAMEGQRFYRLRVD